MFLHEGTLCHRVLYAVDDAPKPQDKLLLDHLPQTLDAARRYEHAQPWRQQQVTCDMPRTRHKRRMREMCAHSGEVFTLLLCWKPILRFTSQKLQTKRQVVSRSGSSSSSSSSSSRRRRRSRSSSSSSSRVTVAAAIVCRLRGPEKVGKGRGTELVKQAQSSLSVYSTPCSTAPVSFLRRTAWGYRCKPLRHGQLGEEPASPTRFC